MSAIEELRRLHEGATPGPWRWWHRDGSPWEPGSGHPWRLSSDDPDHGGVLDHRYPDILDPADAALIAAMRNALPALLACAEAMPKDPWLLAGGWACYSCRRDMTLTERADGDRPHAADCAWLRATTLLGGDR